MTIDEYRRALETLSEDALRTFGERFGGGPMGREARVKQFARERKHERLICYLLTELGVKGLKSEDEKMVEAAVQSATAAKESAELARSSATTARWSVFVAVIAAIIAFAAATGAN
jgi:hypothetical protein